LYEDIFFRLLSCVKRKKVGRGVLEVIGGWDGPGREDKEAESNVVVAALVHGVRTTKERKHAAA
jgi:hypothetical protein